MPRAIALLILAVLPMMSLAQAGVGQAGPEFPPGLFDDGRRYSLKDLEGKAVVLFFYEQDCPRCRGTIPERNAVVAQYADKPVKFIAVAAGDSMREARSYLSTTRLNMPVFADTFSVMEKRYGFNISMQNVWQLRVIGPDGKVAAYGMEPADIDKALAKVKWKYKDGGYDERLAEAVDRFEWGLYAEGMRLLRPHLKSSRKEVKESAQKLYDAVKAEGDAWMSKALELSDREPAEAYDLYVKTAAAFAGEELGKLAGDAMKKLRATRAVKDELAARAMYERLCDGVGAARAEQRREVGEFAAEIARKYPDTPTGRKVAEFVKQL